MSTGLVDEEFRRRLRLIMQQFGSVADLARAVGVSDNAIYKWVAGRGQPSLVNVVRLARAARVSVEWLATGEDAPKKAQARGQGLDQYVDIAGNSLYARASRPAIETSQFVDYLAFKSEWLRRCLNSDAKNLMLLEVLGDSMSPTIDEGDLVLVDLREPRFRHDGIYVLRSGSDLSVKRVQSRPDGKLAIRSDNPAYESAVVAPESINILGRVLWAGGKV
jgi:phage repressor protein C with HTH and peptisase S24 domain